MLNFMDRVIILLANGFEEIEALAPLDVLRRLNYDVKLVSMNDTLEVISSHNVSFKADLLFSEEVYLSAGVIIPGGMPGAKNLRDDLRVLTLVKRFNEEHKLIASICAGPIVLGKANILTNHYATCYPGFESELNALEVLKKKVVVSDNVITSRGPATAFDFAFEIASYLGLDTSNLLKGMLFKEEY